LTASFRGAPVVWLKSRRRNPALPACGVAGAWIISADERFVPHQVSPMPLTGGCQCGSIRYEVTGEPVELYVCHCTECRKQSASAFGISVIVRSDDFKLLQGEALSWTRKADSGNALTCFFCPICGSRVWHGARHPGDTISVKGGSLDEPPDLDQAIHIWTKRKLKGVLIPAHCRQFPEEPEE
jgi:hypothetical protein